MRSRYTLTPRAVRHRASALAVARTSSGGTTAWRLVLPAFPALLLIQVGCNLVNDAVDFVRGADTDERVGPRRVTQSGVFSPAAVHAAGVACFLAAAACVAPAVRAPALPRLPSPSSCAADLRWPPPH